MVWCGIWDDAGPEVIEFEEPAGVSFDVWQRLPNPALPSRLESARGSRAFAACGSQSGMFLDGLPPELHRTKSLRTTLSSSLTIFRLYLILQHGWAGELLCETPV